MGESEPAPAADQSGGSGGQLRREIGVSGAIGMGLGSILGTGVFVSIGIAAGVTGPAVILAIGLAGLVATFNALNSAQLAAALPVSGGAYAYGYRYLYPWLGFTAGWVFLIAKTASAATAALGFAAYLTGAAGVSGQAWSLGLSLGLVTLLTGLVLTGIRRSSAVNLIIVSVTVLALVAFAILGATAVSADNLTPFFRSDGSAYGPLAKLFEATALMFVAFTGYGRIATLGEEVRSPERTIPRAIVATLVVSVALFVGVGVAGVGAVGAQAFARASEGPAAPLASVAHCLGSAGVGWLVTLGALTAMAGVALNLVLGLSRMLFAMGRQGDMPRLFGQARPGGRVPQATVLVVGLAIAGLALIGDVETTWSLSAFTVLVYYAVNNLAALALPAHQRRYPKILAWLGLAGCLFLAFHLKPVFWATGLGLVALGLGWKWVLNRRRA